MYDQYSTNMYTVVPHNSEPISLSDDEFRNLFLGVVLSECKREHFLSEVKN